MKRRHRYEQVCRHENGGQSARRVRGRVAGEKPVHLLRLRGEKGRLRADGGAVSEDGGEREGAREALAQGAGRDRRHEGQSGRSRRGRKLRMDRHVSGLRQNRRGRGLPGAGAAFPPGRRDREAP